MPDVTDQPAKPVRTWRPMAAWTVAGMLVLGAIAASAVVATRKRTTGGEISLKRERERLAELKTAEFRKWATEAEDTGRDRDKRAYAVLRIAELGSEESAQFLAKAWDAPLNVLNHEKLCLIDWAGEFGGADCVPMLKKALSCPAPDERWHAARALLRIQGADGIPLVAPLAEKDVDGIVRSQTKQFISDTVSRADALSDHSAIVRTVVQWGKSLDAGPYIEESVVYLLRQDHPTTIRSDSLRLYSEAELKLLDKMFQAYAIRGIRIADPVATAVLKKAVDPPDDPVPFPYAGWTLNLEKKAGTWSVVKAVKNESRGLMGNKPTPFETRGAEPWMPKNVHAMMSLPEGNPAKWLRVEAHRRRTASGEWELHGLLRAFGRDECLVAEMEYDGNVSHGSCTFYHLNGRISSRRHYMQGKPHGECTEWDDQGRVTHSARYDRGEPVKTDSSKAPNGPTEQELARLAEGVTRPLIEQCDFIMRQRNAWREDGDSGALSWLYSLCIGRDKGLRLIDDVIWLLGAPTHNQLQDGMTEYASPDGATIILFHWSDKEPRTLEAWKQQ